MKRFHRKGIRHGDDIITFLARLEDFQKKLWLKKKFVVQCDYCIMMDRVPEELLPVGFARTYRRPVLVAGMNIAIDVDNPDEKAWLEKDGKVVSGGIVEKSDAQI